MELKTVLSEQAERGKYFSYRRRPKKEKKTAKRVEKRRSGGSSIGKKNPLTSQPIEPTAASPNGTVHLRAFGIESLLNVSQFGHIVQQVKKTAAEKCSFRNIRELFSPRDGLDTKTWKVFAYGFSSNAIFIAGGFPKSIRSRFRTEMAITY